MKPGSEKYNTAAAVLDRAKVEAYKHVPRVLEYERAEDLPDEFTPEDELIEGLIGRAALSVLYGDSNSGKTFLAVDIACAVARGAAWMGRNVERGMVVYLATEAPASVRKRLQAYQHHHGCRVPDFFVVKSPLNLFDTEADATAVIKLVKQLESDHGAKCELVVGDTLARLSAGANENAGDDMTVVLRHVDRIRQEIRCHFMLVHHSGKDSARGMRGWSGLRAAVDTEIEITSDEATGARAAEITKQRDMGGKGDRIGFCLDVVTMGVGKWGKPNTSCVVVPAAAPERADRLKRGKKTSEIAGAIVEALTQRGAGMKKSELASHFEGRYVDTSVYREIRRMVGDGRLHETSGFVALRSGE